MSGSQKQPSSKLRSGVPSKPVRAFVLIQTLPGRVAAIMRVLEKMAAVKGVDPVTGPYDVVAYLEVEELRDISGVVAGTIWGLKGVTHTTTLLCV